MHRTIDLSSLLWSLACEVLLLVWGIRALFFDRDKPYVLGRYAMIYRPYAGAVLLIGALILLFGILDELGLL